MRGIAVFVGVLLVIGGGVVVASLDQQRAASLAEAQAAVASAQRQLDARKEANYRLAEMLTALRSQIAAQEAQIADSTGFLP